MLHKFIHHSLLSASGFFRFLFTFLSAAFCLSVYGSILENKGDSASIPLDSSGEAVLSVNVEKGDYIAGRIWVSEGVKEVNLTNPEGEFIRKIKKNNYHMDEFFFIAEGKHRIHIQGSDEAEVKIQLDQRVPVDQQISDESPLASQTINRLIHQLNETDNPESLIQGFWETVEQKGTPLIEIIDDEQAVVTYLVKGAKRKVVILGAPASGKHEMENIPQTDIWYKSFIAPRDTRVSYRLAIDPPNLPASAQGRWGRLLSVAKADPLNKAPWPANEPDPYRQESTYALDEAPTFIDIATSDLTYPKPILTSHTLWSERLGNSRQIRLYKSPTIADVKSSNHTDYPLLFILDGDDYVERVDIPSLLDKLVLDKKLPPLRAVFISNSSPESRATELPNNPRFAEFMAKELKPWAIKQFNLDRAPRQTLITGSSYGGLASLYIALLYPHDFNHALVLSGSFWWGNSARVSTDQPSMQQLIATQDTAPIRVIVTAGLFEGATDGSPSILETSRQVRDLLTAKNYDFHYQEYATGHSYFSWQGAMMDGLQQFFGGHSSSDNSTLAKHAP